MPSLLSLLASPQMRSVPGFPGGPIEVPAVGRAAATPGGEHGPPVLGREPGRNQRLGYDAEPGPARRQRRLAWWGRRAGGGGGGTGSGDDGGAAAAVHRVAAGEVLRGGEGGRTTEGPGSDARGADRSAAWPGWRATAGLQNPVRPPPPAAARVLLSLPSLCRGTSFRSPPAPVEHRPWTPSALAG